MRRRWLSWRKWLNTSINTARMERRPKLAAVVKELAEAEAILSQRIRHIKIADRFEHGWVEYETDKLALDSDDEKRLTRVEKTAQKKAARKKL